MEVRFYLIAQLPQELTIEQLKEIEQELREKYHLNPKIETVTVKEFEVEL